MSGVRLSRIILPSMLANNWGRILFISSECASLTPPDLIAYSMTKAAILAVSRGLAQLTKGTNVTINSVIPGSTLSEGAEQFLEDAAQKKRKTKDEIENAFFTEVRTTSLLQRFAKVEEVADTIVYITSPRSSATNGAAIKVDGGSSGGLF
jgi:NAD(P)-dependent dehydrogenase (short-subunit alcohol dehydrogenase family)